MRTPNPGCGSGKVIVPERPDCPTTWPRESIARTVTCEPIPANETEVIGRLVESRLASMRPGTDHFELPEEESRSVGIRKSELIMDRSQAHLVIGFRGITLADPDRTALELIAQILAGQGGRLFLDLRDRQSLAYTVSASNIEGLAPGYFTIYIATAPEKVERARAGIFEEIDRLVSAAPSAEELQHAIRFGTGSFAIDSQRSHGRAAH
ncbi:MAG TPA: insulinase family protein, partial [Candidatus Poseidoniales archaeon]|nr:insulinase family protein [Candidatus Poseidoniales archaeon]